MFYALGHFSKFIPRGSTVVETSVDEGEIVRSKVFSAAFITPENQTVVVVLSRLVTN